MLFADLVSGPEEEAMSSVAYAPHLPRVYHLMLKRPMILLEPTCGKKPWVTVGQQASFFLPTFFLFCSLH